MTGSEFLRTFAKAPLQEWEAAVVREAQSGGLVAWPMVPVRVEAGGHEGTVFVASDVVAVGTPQDYVRVPLTSISAQKVADALGMMLPTSKMAQDIWRGSFVKLPPRNLLNKGANLAQYAEHSKIVDDQLASIVPLGSGFLVGGHKKDVILSNTMTPGKVVIFGWFRPDGTFIQPKTNVHGDFYVDYSHGIRMVAPTMQIDGHSALVQDVAADPVLSKVLSTEGPLRFSGYASKFGGPPRAMSKPVSKIASRDVYNLGVQTMISISRMSSNRVV